MDFEKMFGIIAYSDDDMALRLVKYMQGLIDHEELIACSGLPQI